MTPASLNRHSREGGDPLVIDTGKNNGMVAPSRYGIEVPKWKLRYPLTRDEATEMKITTTGIDLAKSVFQVHGVDERDRAVLKTQLKRGQVMAFFANLPPCLIGMEASGS